MINRWYVLDLRPGASLVEALVGAGIDVFTSIGACPKQKTAISIGRWWLPGSVVPCEG